MVLLVTFLELLTFTSCVLNNNKASAFVSKWEALFFVILVTLGMKTGWYLVFNRILVWRIPLVEVNDINIWRGCDPICIRDTIRIDCLFEPCYSSSWELGRKKKVHIINSSPYHKGVFFFFSIPHPFSVPHPSRLFCSGVAYGIIQGYICLCRILI